MCSSAPMAAARAICWKLWESSRQRQMVRSTTRVCWHAASDLGSQAVQVGLSAVPGTGKSPPHLHFAAQCATANYEITLHNPLLDPAPAWRFKTEVWEEAGDQLVGRSPATQVKSNPERGLAALKAADTTTGAALDLLSSLQGYVIFTPTTAVLRGVAPETQPRHPLGLCGGNLPQAVLELLAQSKQDARSKEDLSGCTGAS